MQPHVEPSPASGSSARLGLWISLVLALLTAIFLIQNRRGGQDWGGDFALYISHARNLSEGKPYADTGYILNPYYRSHSPASYPPLFPLVLAPIYARYGLDYSILVIPGILCFAASIPILFCLFRRDLPTVQSLLAVSLWAGWPFMLWFKDLVLPDLIFTLLWVLALWLVRTVYEDYPSRPPLTRAILIGVISYAAYATRSPGFILPGAIICYEVLRRKKIGRFPLTVAATFGVLAICQNLFIHSETSYLQTIVLAPVKTVSAYLYSLSTVFSTATSGGLRVARYAAAAVAALLCGVGFLW